jgi:hypothetical protein
MNDDQAMTVTLTMTRAEAHALLRSLTGHWPPHPDATKAIALRLVEVLEGRAERLGSQ